MSGSVGLFGLGEGARLLADVYGLGISSWVLAADTWVYD